MQRSAWRNSSLSARHRAEKITDFSELIIKGVFILEDRKYVVEFRIEVDASDSREALEIARDGVMLDYADAYVDGVPL